MIQNNLFWKLPHDVRRSVFKYVQPEEFKKLIAYRTRDPEKITAQTFKPFLDNKSLFVHIPKAAGISIGHGIYGRHTGNHTSIAEYQMAFSKAEFDGMFKFAFVRNPWDRLVSAFHFMKAGGRNPGDKSWADTHLTDYENFNSFVLQWLNEENVMKGVHFQPQHTFLTTPETEDIQVDFIGRFENIEEDWKHLTYKLNVVSDLQTINHNPDRTRDYRNEYSAEAAKIVEDVYQKDIALFGYSFG